MLSRYLPFLLLLTLQVFADEESLMELKGKVEDVIKNKGLTCYVCTSYLPQCNGTVDNSQKWVPHMLCKGKCFVRVGEEKATALYRGCTDGWNKVKDLDFDYVGCRNHIWNGMNRTWCLCDTERCNGESLETLSGLTRSRSYTSAETAKESISYSVNAVDDSDRDKHAVPVSHFKDYNHAYDDNVAYSDKGQYYDDSVYDDDNYVDTVKYEKNDVKEKKKEHRYVRLIHPSPIPHDENTPIQEDKGEYVKPRDETKSDRKEDTKDYPQYGYDDAISYKSKDPERHHTVEEYKPKKRRSGDVIRRYRSETRTEKYEGKDRGHTGHVREDSYVYRDNQGRDYPLYSQDKTFTDIDQVHYGESNDIYVKPSEDQKADKPYILPDVPKPFWEPVFTDDFVPGAYYPYGHEIPVYKNRENLEGRENQEDKPRYQEVSTTTTTTTTHPPPTKLAFNPTTDYMLGHGSNTDHPMPGERVFCSETGFYQHPTDCSAFIACTIDDHVSKPVMNHMRCPKGLFWDNARRTCDYYSSTCKNSKASQKANLIELEDYGKDYEKVEYEKEEEEEIQDQHQNKKVYTDLEESHGYEELHDASFESKKAYFRK